MSHDRRSCFTACKSKELTATRSRSGFIPLCEPNGRNYQARQCDAISRQCWCVTTSGEEISGTRTLPGSITFSNTCQTARQNLIRKPRYVSLDAECECRFQKNVLLALHRLEMAQLAGSMRTVHQDFSAHL